MSQNPEVDAYVRQISSKTTYPLHNVGQVIDALGGDNSIIDFEGRRGRAGRIRQFIPDHYFPVVSEADLSNKADDLLARHMGQPLSSADIPAQREEDMPESLREFFRQFSSLGVDLARVAPSRDGDIGTARFSAE